MTNFGRFRNVRINLAIWSTGSLFLLHPYSLECFKATYRSPIADPSDR